MSYIGQRPVVGRYIKLDQISSGFNGSNTGFSMTAGSQAVFPGTARNLLLSLGGVIQEPDTDFTISGSTLTFTTPPVANTTFFGVIYGDMQATGTPSDGTVLPASIASSGNFSFPEVTVTGDVNIADSIIHSGDTDTKIRFPAANKFSVETGGAERLSLGTTTVFNETGADVDFRIEGDTRQFLFYVDATNDRIGIDRSSPDAVFHIFDNPDHGNDRAALKVEAFRPKIRLQDRSSSANSAEVLCDGNALRFNVSVPSNDTTNLTERLRIDSSGRVGIGTNSPQVTGIHINGSSARLQLTDSTTGTASGDGVIFGLNGSQDFFINNRESSKNVLFFTENTERMRIDSSGRVGIGTTSPTEELTISSATPAVKLEDTDQANSYVQFSAANGDLFLSANGASSQGQFILRSGNGGSFVERMRINSSGNVGIGTTSPTTTLHLDASTGAVLQLQRTASNASNRFILSVDGTNGTLDSSNATLFRNNAAERMRIDSSGNVGIGTSSPDRKFDVSGTGNVYAKFQSTNTTGAGIEVKDTGENWLIQADGGVGPGLAFYDLGRTVYRMVIDSSGRVNIGLTSQSVSKLYVSGGSLSVVGSDSDFGGGGNRVFLDHDNNDVRFGFTGGGGSATNRGIRFHHCPNSTGTASTNRITEIGEFKIGHDGNSDAAVSTDKVHTIGGCNTDSVTSNLARLCMQERSGNWISFKDGGGTHHGTISRSGSGVSYGSNSDYRLKDNVANLTGGIAFVKQLRPVTFNWNDLSGLSKTETHQGFIAHEVQALMSDAVEGEKDGIDIWGDCTDSEGNVTQTHVPESKKKDGEIWTKKGEDIHDQQLDTGKLIPILTAALQEAVTEIETLKTKVAALEAA